MGLMEERVDYPWFCRDEFDHPRRRVMLAAEKRRRRRWEAARFSILEYKTIESKFVKNDVYDRIDAPQWVDFTFAEERVDYAWFCRDEFVHPETESDASGGETAEEAMGGCSSTAFADYLLLMVAEYCLMLRKKLKEN
ncbi:putative telomerase reverse transcriptase-like [Salvia divinorum]|uniref:Telomerase reverse transcriptase-like n=1 Tax=Salvia divinorum TaxID=28513 RepID=A0ABD1H5F0_SALDI